MNCDFRRKLISSRLFSERFISFWKKKTFGIRREFLTAYFIVGTMLIAALSFCIFNTVFDYLSAEINKHVFKLAQQFNNSIESYLDEMEQITRNLGLNRNLVYLLDYYNEQNFDNYSGALKFFENADSVISLKKYCDYYLFLENTKHVYSSHASDETIDYEKLGVLKKEWYEKMIGSPNSLVLLTDFRRLKNNSSESMFAYAYKLERNDAKGDAFLIVTSRKDYFDYLLKNTELDALDFLVICDENYNIIYNSDPDKTEEIGISQQEIGLLTASPKTIDTKNYNNLAYLVTVNTSAKTGWKIVSFTSKIRLNKETNKINAEVYIFTSVFILVLFFVTIVITYRITSPIKKLTEIIGNVKNNKYMFDESFDYNNEIGELGRSYNSMMKQLLETKVLRKEAQILALQQQINPHFLHNTLETINSLAEKHKCFEICTISEKLGSMFRYNIGRAGTEFVEVRDELEHVGNYISIQNIRFKGRFEVRCHIVPELLSMLSPKFILQPVVENAIYHGLESVSKGGLLEISVFSERESLFLKVADNGVGMDDEKLKRLLNSIEQDDAQLSEGSFGIGLKNVHYRLRLLFGVNYGIRIISSAGRGTQVTIELPILKKEEQSGV